MVTFIEHFRHYLAVKPFTLRTDHNSLRWLHSFHEPQGQLARWLERLADYNYVVQHRPGKSHGNADGLSRRPTDTDDLSPPLLSPVPTVAATELTPPEGSSWMPAWTTTDVYSAQQSSPFLAYLWQCRTEGASPASDHPALMGISRQARHLLAEFDRLEIHNTLLFRRFVPDDSDDDSHLQLIVPTSLQNEILELSHSHATGGHLGPQRMLARISTDFYWPGWRSAVQLFCKVCPDCARRKSPPSPRATMVAVRSGYPWERIALDILGPLPRTQNGNRYRTRAISDLSRIKPSLK